MSNPINATIGPHIHQDTTGATALAMKALSDPDNNIGNQLYKLYSTALDDYRTNQGTQAALEAQALYDQGKSFSEVLPLMQDKYSAGALAKAKLGAVYSGALKDITERDTNQRGWEENERSEKRLGLEGERVGIAKGHLKIAQENAARLARQALLLEEAKGLSAGYLEAKAQGLGRAYIDQNRQRIENNSYAKSDIFNVAGNDLIDYSPDDAEVSKNLKLVDPESIRANIRSLEEKRRALTNTEGMSLLIDEDGSVRRKSSNEVFKELAKGREYTGRDYAKFQENYNQEYARLKSLYPNLDDVTLGAILAKSVGTRTLLEGNIPLINNRVDDWDILWNGISEKNAEAAASALKYLTPYKNLLDDETRFKAIEQNESIKKITTELSNKIKNIQSAVAAGRFSAVQGQKAIDRARAEASASISPIIQLLDRALKDGAGVPNTLTPPK